MPGDDRYSKRLESRLFALLRGYLCVVIYFIDLNVRFEACYGRGATRFF